ncbi:MAG: DUF998 domain-containing protein [Pseudonocardia sp.]
MTRTVGTRPGSVAWIRDPAVWPAVPACVAVAASSITVLPLVGDDVDPVRQPLSDHATQATGFVLVGIAALAMAAAAALLRSALGRGGLPRARPVRVLLGVWSTALVLVAAFPTNVPGTAPDTSSLVHRVAAAGVVAVPPVIGWLTAVRARAAERWAPAAPSILAWSRAAAVLGAAFLAAHFPILTGGAPYPVLGVLERVLCVAVVALVLVLARAARLADGHRVPSPATAAEMAT